jgi:hypothetical protein
MVIEEEALGGVVAVEAAPGEVPGVGAAPSAKVR